MAQDRDKWRALVNTAMKLSVPRMVGNSLTGRGATILSITTLLHVVSKSVSHSVC